MNFDTKKCFNRILGSFTIMNNTFLMIKFNFNFVPFFNA